QDEVRHCSNRCGRRRAAWEYRYQRRLLQDTDMAAQQRAVLQPATVADAALLANLLELYVHEMSEIFPVEIGADGRFGYPELPRYWSEPSTHLAFLIRTGPHVGGFALVTRGSAATTDPQDFDLAEFFILRSYRRTGLGRGAAFALWDRVRGH